MKKKIVSTMIDLGMVHCVVSTGALIAHGLSESVGKTHYRVKPSMSDEELFKKGYNRVYDTLEMETNLNYVEQVVSQTMKRVDPAAMLVTSTSPMRMLVVNHRDFHAVMDEFPGVAAQVLATLSHRIRRLDSEAAH